MDTRKYTVSNVWVEEHSTGIGKTNSFPIPRPWTSLALIIQGGGSFREDERSGEIRSGDIFFVPFGATYTSTWQTGEVSRYISCHFNLPLFQDPMRRYRVMSLGNHGLSDRFPRLWAAYMQNDCTALLREFYLILDCLLPRLECKKSAADPRIADAIRYIDDHFTSQIHVPELARMVGMSEAYFYVKFREYMNMTPIEYKNQAAVAFAKEMLVYNPSMPIEEVSEAAGFESSIYFRRVFRTLTGMSPKEYRKNERGDL